MLCGISTVDDGHRLSAAGGALPALAASSTGELVSHLRVIKFSASQPLPPHNPLLDGHFPVLPRKKGIALGGRGEGVGTSRPFIIARGRGEWDTGQSVPSSHCPLELRKTYSAPPKPVAIQPCVPASLLRYGLLASEHVLQTGRLTTAIPQ